MDFLGLIYALFIGPLELFFEVLYDIAYRFTDDPGVSIVFLSLAMNFLVLPLYRRADAMQEAERVRSMKMKPWTDHIKKTFKGDERFMMLQAYNRQCGYKPTDALKGSVSLLLEIPFFIAAYHFLSNLTMLHGVPFGPIADLGAPDGLINLGGGLVLNLLPILMTAINLASAIVYMKGLPLSNKVQMYGIAAIFLVLLYNSPAGLVFYWTLNNVFSLVKNVFYRLKNPGAVLCVIASLAGIAFLVYGCIIEPTDSVLRQGLVLVVGVGLQVPIAWRLMRSKGRGKVPFSLPELPQPDSRAFLLCALFLTLLTGALIPLSVVQASPTEFAAASSVSPLWHIAHSLALACGLFIVWFGVFYWLMTPRGKTVFICIMFACAGAAVIDYLVFVPDFGNLSVDLQFEGAVEAPMGAAAVNLLAIAAVSAALIALYFLKGKAAKVAVASLCVAAGAMSVVGAVGLGQNLAAAGQSANDGGAPHVSLSKDGKNVVVLMMDRAIGYYIPYLLNENPELQEKLAGFTYFPNAVSYGLFTNVGSPGLYGGYDYIPEAMNARDDTPLADKHDEALKVMPKVFMDAGYEATFFDPTYAGYTFVPDLTVFDDMPELNTYISLSDNWETREGFKSSMEDDAKRERNFFCYSLLRIAPVAAQSAVYHEGDYNSPEPGQIQVVDGSSRAVGIETEFMAAYSVLQKLPELATVEDGDQDVLFIMSNDTTHSPAVLQEPEYIPAEQVDNTAYDKEHERRYAADGSYIELREDWKGRHLSPLMHYEVNMAALRELCNWFDYLRENGAWDNTRIIVVSDHGRNLDTFEDLTLVIGEGHGDMRDDLMMANCLLMVKDFDSDEFTVDDRFMTNADTPALAMEGLIDNPVNPFTGNAIDTTGKEGGAHILFSYEWDTSVNDGNTFNPDCWFEVDGNIFDRENWTYLGYY